MIETIITFFQDRLLELRIWSKDLIACHPSFLEKIDELSGAGTHIADVGPRLSFIFQEISDDLLPFFIETEPGDVENAEDHPALLVEGCSSTHSMSKTHPKPCHNVSLLGRACDHLHPLVRKLLDQKSALRDILKTHTHSEGVEDTRECGDRFAVPNVLCFGMVVSTRQSRVLCVDGGGVKSLSSLLILKDLMERINRKLEDEEPTSRHRTHVQTPPLRPADVFDFMYGSSSGGYAQIHTNYRASQETLIWVRLLAIMLGRLAMTVDECIAEYQCSLKEIFCNPWKITMNGFLRFKYPLSSVEQATRRIVSDYDKSTEDDGWRRNNFAFPSSRCKV